MTAILACGVFPDSVSEVLWIEHSRNRDPLRGAFTKRVLSFATEEIAVDSAVERRAMHLACAVRAGVDFICTCDDKFLRRARKAGTGLTRVASPLELIQEVKR